MTCMGLSGGSDSKESACNTGELGSIPGQQDLLEKGMATMQSSCLENARDRGTWRDTVHGVAESDMTEQLAHLTPAW